MKELLKALEHNGFAKDTATLESVYVNTLQDGQYNPDARSAATFLSRYVKDYGSLTIGDLKSKGPLKNKISRTPRSLTSDGRRWSSHRTPPYTKS